jgi:hypothetical protein
MVLAVALSVKVPGVLLVTVKVASPFVFENIAKGEKLGPPGELDSETGTPSTS